LYVLHTQKVRRPQAIGSWVMIHAIRRDVENSDAERDFAGQRVIVGTIALIAGASVAMTVAWAVAEHTGRSGWADSIWSLSVGALGAIAAIAPFGATAEFPRRYLVTAVAAAWSLRLALHIAHRTRGGGEDPRYAELRRQWGGAAPRRLFWFLQVQAVVAALLAICIGVAAHNPASGLRVQDWLGLAVIVAAIIGESAADRQLRHFRSRPDTRTAVCDVGLWRLSRHPNYFFEWLAWVAYPLIAIDLTGGYAWGWFALSAPALMYWLLVHVSGIPPLEAHMLRSRADSFRTYQAKVNAFWPGPPRTP
jgi:steroid 5-alpha reductase family enzyme